MHDQQNPARCLEGKGATKANFNDTDTDKVVAAMARQAFQVPSGFTSTMDKENHHVHKPVFVGEIKADGQFNVACTTPRPVVADPWSDFIAKNMGKKIP